ncbi:MAG: VWA-like domain-containing protein [Aerococcus urinaeequi]
MSEDALFSGFEFENIESTFRKMRIAYITFLNHGQYEDYEKFADTQNQLLGILTATLMNNQDSQKGARDVLFAGILFHADREMNGSLTKPITIGFRGLDLVMTINPILFYLYYETPEGMLAAIRQMCYHVLFGHIVEYDWAFKDEESAKVMSVAMEAEVNQYVDELPDTVVTLKWVKHITENRLILPKAGTFYYYNELKAVKNDSKKQGHNRTESTFNKMLGSGQMDDLYSQLAGNFDPNKAEELRIDSAKQLKEEMKNNRTMQPITPNSQYSDLYRKLMNGLIKDSHSQMTEELRLKLSSEVKVNIEKITKQRALNWRDVIKRGMGTTLVPYKMSKNRMNRRQPHRVDLPGRILDAASRLVAFFDTSASQNEEALAYSLGELANIQKTLHAEVWVVHVDTTVQYAKPLSFQSLKDMEFVGRGGTSFAPAYQWLHEQGFTNEDTVAVYFTDGYGDDDFERYGFTNMYWVLTETEVGDSSPLSTDGGGKVLYLKADERYNRHVLHHHKNAPISNQDSDHF